LKIKHQLISGFAGQSVISIVVLLSLIVWIVGNKTQTSLQERAKEQLVSVRDATKNSVERYFDTLQNQVITFSNDKMIIDAMRGFSTAFKQYKNQTSSDLALAKLSLKNYYIKDFDKEFNKRNTEQKSKSSQWLKQLDDDSIALQDAFISNNREKLGEKDKLSDLDNRSLYAKLHSDFHSHIRDYQARFAYYDIFLVDSASGDIVYSVFKELDFTTSLIDGPFSNTGIGEAFRVANQLTDASATTVTDFSPYPASYMDMASFIASPIYDNGRKIGILIFQMPISTISAIMTHDQKWNEVGLGESGETYLVGDDGFIRTDSRFFIEDPQGYFAALKTSGFSLNTIDKIKVKKSGIGLQKVETTGVSEALAGKTSFQVFPDYRNVPVLSAYAPVNIHGLNWVIMAEIDEEEAFRPVEDIRSALITYTLSVGFIVIVLSILGGVFISNQISTRLTNMIEAMKPLAEGDLSKKLDGSKKDEIGEFAYGFNQFIDKLRTMVGGLIDVVKKLSEHSIELTDNSKRSLTSISSQQSETEQLATAMTEMQATLAEVACNVESAASATYNITTESTSAKAATEDNLNASKILASLITDTSNIVSELEKDSDAIGSVLDVIKQIADQTNLLALNAAIEAARAGEQGRGFAVVADEVRTLASRTQASTEEIQTMIEKLQSATKMSVVSMNKSAEQAIESETLSNKTFDVLTVIDKSLTSINDMTTQIATASEEQSVVAEDINRSISQINGLCNESVVETNETARTADEIHHLSTKISNLVNQFKL